MLNDQQAKRMFVDKVGDITVIYTDDEDFKVKSGTCVVTSPYEDDGLSGCSGGLRVTAYRDGEGIFAFLVPSHSKGGHLVPFVRLRYRWALRLAAQALGA